MKEILGEQGFQLTGCTSNECVVEAGKVLGVSQIIAGNIGKIGSLYTISIRLIDVQTGKILKMANVDCECRIEKVLTTSVRNVVERLLGKKVGNHFDNEPQIFPDTVTDIDGNVYKTVKIGSQVWMAENLKVTHYRNGDLIPNVAGKSEWKNLGIGACCNYDNNAAAYGLLYNWYAVNDSRNIAPAGWHVPAEKEWQTLIDYLGGEAVAGGKMKERGTAHWKRPNTGATNSSGFSALSSCYRNDKGTFYGIGNEADYWSGSNGVWIRRLRYSSSGIHHR
ncbi:MAG: hypothetical protein K8R79_12490, partial [Calditrichales bacterium]|nr:hypothetical protein [Calditrichales bacterium]